MDKNQDIDDKILAYLKYQQAEYPENVSPYLHPDFLESLEYAADDDFERFFKDRYDRLFKKHNQHKLFDVREVIPKFFIDENIYEQLAFSETLVISELHDTNDSELKEPVPVGGLSLNIQSVQGLSRHRQEKHFPDAEVSDVSSNVDSTTEQQNDWLEEKLNGYEEYLRKKMENVQDKYVVHLSSRFSFGNKEAGSQITSWIDRKFHTLEEKRTEFTSFNRHKIHEKSLYVALEKDKYYVKHKDTKEDTQEMSHYSLARARMYVGEGADFLLMRYMAITRFVGQFELSAMYINGDLCRNIYSTTGPYCDKVNNVKLDLCKIYRTVIEECGIEHNCSTVLTLNGQIISQEWRGCDYILNINPMLILDNHKVTEYERMSLKTAWKTDMQLFSEYLDRKDTTASQLKTYLKDHQEVQKLIEDYVQNILLLKPENILSFTKEFFQNYLTVTIPNNKYLGKEIDSDTQLNFTL